MKLRYIWTATALVFAMLLTALTPAVSAKPAMIGTHAQAAALIDVESGRLLYSSNGNKRMRIASLTKVMTAIVAIEHGNLSDVVKTSRRAAGKEGSSIYLRVGEEMSLHHMLYGLMLRSGNDAATAIAEHVGGSEEGFVHLMNEKANVLGLTNTHFMNPHGLDHDDHYSTANDLAKLTAYSLKNDTFRDIVKTRVKSVPNPHEEWDYSWTNKNKMLAMYEGADGVKTGYTKKAFRCLISSATRDGQQLAAVTLNDGNDWADHRNLLDWGFANYPLETLAVEGQKLQGYHLAAARSFRYPLAEGERAAVTTRLTAGNPEDVRTRLGDAGKLSFYLSGKPIGSIPLDALKPPPESIQRDKKEGLAASAASASAMKAEAGVRSWRASFGAVLLALFGKGG